MENDKKASMLWSRYYEQQDNPPDCRPHDPNLYLDLLEFKKVIDSNPGDITEENIACFKEALEWFENLKRYFASGAHLDCDYEDGECEPFRVPSEYRWGSLK